jgi:aromatic-L-amino-acid decarboxylase
MEVRSMDVQEFRDTGHRVVDLISEYLENIEGRPLFPEVEPDQLTALFNESLPGLPTAAGEVIGELSEKLLPNCTHVNHPGYFGLITPSPSPMGILGDFLASALNQNLGTYTVGPAAIALERRTVRWLNDLVGYDDRAGGNLTSGGTMANFIGVKLARDWASEDRAQHEGVRQRFAVYTSQERHVAVDKAVDAVGAGREGLRILPTDDEFRIRIDALEEAITRDKAAGIRPMCIVGISGTTNTGSLDPLPQLREIADRERMWLHVDAAYGGGMLLSRKWPGLLDDLKLADSVTIDPHKWFYAPLDAGAILVRDARRLTASFGMRPPYLTDEMDESGERYQYFVHGFEQSRRFRGLKVWMSFKRYGSEQIGRWIDGNVQQAKHLYDLCQKHPDFRPVMSPPMSAICIRYDPGGIPEDEIGRIHREVVRRIEAGGRFWISTTVLKDRWWFRINPVNIRTRLEHMDELMALLVHECALVTGATAKG